MRSNRVSHSLVLLPALLASVAPASSFAQFSGYYLELSGGHSNAEVEVIPPFSPASEVSQLEADSDMYSLTVGLRFNDTFSVEMAYSDYGSFSGPASLRDAYIHVEVDPASNEQSEHPVNVQVDVEGDYELMGYSASVLANFPLGRRLNLYGELGLVAWSADSELDGTLTEAGGIDRTRTLRGKLSDSGSSFFYSAGLHYRFNLAYGVHLEYQQFHFDSEIFSSRGDVNNINLGFRFYF